jgi:PIN domain nuclease of toxin-antitoxin system
MLKFLKSIPAGNIPFHSRISRWEIQISIRKKKQPLAQNT